jgi:CDP-glucose 4,6-dehydratase
VEDLVMRQFGEVYRGRRVLVTGHTGFKGSWLALWLKTLGARITGIALDPVSRPSHWELLQLGIDDRRIDIREQDALLLAIRDAAPEIVFHLAAQPLVLRSYREPVETWSTNVMGTVNLLEACRSLPCVRAMVVVTSDKCYQNREWDWSYREIDRLGGHDPYSASKACTEVVVASYRDAFLTHSGAPLLASARAGNVIGGGDWSDDRLIPDLVRAATSGTTVEIRSPNATRPWQHVLEPLSGYLLLGQKLLEGNPGLAQAWNFGPDEGSNRTVSEILARIKSSWPKISWHVSSDPQPHEANLLQLDSSKARRHLGWRPVWALDECLQATVDWYRTQMDAGTASSARQLDAYVTAAGRAELCWCAP